MASVLALDCSGNVGWALFKSPAGAVRFGTWKTPHRLLDSDNYGGIFVALEAWLADMLAVHAPDVVAFEAPLALFQHRAESQSSYAIVRILIGLATVVELVAVRQSRRCIEVPVPTAKERLAGTRYASKHDMVMAAVHLGHLVEDDHQADAIAVALCAYDHMGEGE